MSLVNKDKKESLKDSRKLVEKDLTNKYEYAKIEVPSDRWQRTHRVIKFKNLLTTV